MRACDSSSSATSSARSPVAAPRNVHIVRWASGVTNTRHRAVGSPSLAGGVSYSTPTERMSWVNTPPSWSSRTFPTKPAVPPNDATPATVLAAEPPEDSTAGPMAEYRRSACSASMSAIVPLTRSWRRRSASPAWAMTSTIALPTATTSISGYESGTNRTLTSEPMHTDGPHRLPRHVEPRRYDLTLTPDLTEGTFAGEERVEVVVREPTAEIVLNAVDLRIADAELVAEDGRAVAATV